MGMTLAEKLIAKHAGKDTVVPGEFVTAKVDIVMANDVTAPAAIRVFNKGLGAKEVFDRERVALCSSHFTPNKDIASAEMAKVMRDFAKAQSIKYYFEVGRGGVEHVVLPEKGIVLPGDLIVGGDSHTCTYGALGAFASGFGSTDVGCAMATGDVWLRVPETIRIVVKGKFLPWVGAKDLVLHVIGRIGDDGALYQALQWEGETIEDLSISGRLTISNMAIEAGGKAGLMIPDQKTIDYCNERKTREFTPQYPDADATYFRTIEVDVSALEPTISCPMLPSNTRTISQVAGQELDQIYIGSCTNGRLEDLRLAASVLKGRQTAIRTIVVPGSQEVWMQANAEGILQTFAEAGCVVSTPGCGACLGGYMGVLGKDERCLSTTNRNYVGRMGHPEAKVWLANPAIAAAAAVAGKITHPDDLGPIEEMAV
ncbi:MAG: 3-isopropylmalate dehydratase large subunit [Deltaproteobacteria bacterium]|nr:3-isopropylmalate dehydratase large subunit [Deltaproteobacteria bacterium]